MTTHRDGNETIKSDETLLSILNSLKESHTAGITELSEELDLAKSTVHKHLATLQKHGFVKRVNERYQLGFKFLDYGIAVRNSTDAFLVGKDKIDKLAASIDERVYLIVEENGLALIVYVNPDEARPKDYARLGQTKYLHQTSAGKAILAHLSENRIEEIIEQHGLPSATENSIQNRTTLSEELETIRERGYAVNQEESIKGLSGVATSIFDQNDEILGAVCISAPARQLSDEDLHERFPKLLMGLSNEIEIDLVYS